MSYLLHLLTYFNILHQLRFWHINICGCQITWEDNTPDCKLPVSCEFASYMSASQSLQVASLQVACI